MKRVILGILMSLFLFLGIANAQSLRDMRTNKASTLNFVTFFDDFFNFRHYIDSTGTTIGDNDFMNFGWVATVVGSSLDTCVVVSDEMNGILKLTNAASDNDGAGFQWNSEVFDCDLDTTTGFRPWTISAKVKLGEATQSDFIFGLVKTDSDLRDAADDGVYFFKADGQDTILCIVNKNDAGDTTQTNSVFTDSTWVKLDIDFNGRNRIIFRIDDAVVATHTTVANFPNDELLAMTFGFWNGQAVAEVFWIDWFYASQARKESY